MLKNRDALNSSILTAKVRPLGAQESSWVLSGSIWGSLGASFRAQLGSFFQDCFKGGFQGGFWLHFGVLLEAILGGFLTLSESILGVILEPAV